MKIDLLHYSVPPIVGGVESVISHHARLITDACHSVRLLAGRGESISADIPFIPIPLADSRHPTILEAKEQLDQGRVPGNFEALVDELYAIIYQTTRETELLIAHNVCSLHKNLALTAALHRLSQEEAMPHIILWHHDLAWTTPRYQPELHNGYPWDLLRQDWSAATQVVVSNLRRSELSELLQIPPERVTVIPNGVDIRQFFKLEDRSMELIQQLNLLTAQPVLLLPVRITRRKNIELAVRTMAALREVFPDARLVITGPLGPHNPTNIRYFNRLKALRDELGLQDTVNFMAEISQDYLPDAVVSDFYRLADGLFMPSREEGFGIPVLEAGISGLPVFCTDIPPLKYLAGESAVYFSPDAEPGQIAKLIYDHLSNDRAYQLRIRARTKFTWERVYQEQIEPLLRKTHAG